METLLHVVQYADCSQVGIKAELSPDRCPYPTRKKEGRIRFPLALIQLEAQPLTCIRLEDYTIRRVR